MKILIVEDDLLIAEMLKEMLFELGYKKIFIAKNYNEAKQQLVLNNIDLAFLDINLTDLKSGIDVAKYITVEHKIPFVYLTSYSDPKTVKNATETLPESYLIKPFIKSDLFTTLEMVKARNQVKSDCFVKFKDGNDVIKIYERDLLYVQSEKNYLNVFTNNGRHVCRQSLDSFISNVKSNKFIRVHRSFAVNMSKVEKKEGQILVIGKFTIPISRNCRNDVQSFFL